jgi:tetratricopeptide (TPR) repeat protein
MSDRTASVDAVELLIDEAWAAYEEGRYLAALAAASRAVAAAERLDDPGLLVRSLEREASALRMSGDDAALARYTRVLALAEDPTTRDRLDQPETSEAVARAYMNWVECARFMTGFEVRELFGVLDAAERWLTATGHRDWRAGILRQRAGFHSHLGELDEALAAAEEALAVYHPRAPGYTLSTYRCHLGDILCDMGRESEAEPHYQAILDDLTAGSYDRKVALQGLARCALARDDPHTAHRHAMAAVQLAEAIGDDALQTALWLLVEAHRALGDYEAAWHTATRQLDGARRIGGHHTLYYAVRAAAGVALDRGELDTARDLITELDQHAAAIDADTGNTTFTDDAAEHHSWLAELDGNH